ncbi:MAG: hypothetical protein IPM37_23015 [Hahellaceae bacterium]|nr:hypothetical protein [Hahellaceae bacterium]
MTMRHHYLVTHWTPEEAHTILEFLDQLRELIWQNYGCEIVAMQQDAQCQWEDESDTLGLEGDSPF